MTVKISDYTLDLQRLMQQAGFSSLKALSQTTGVSELDLIRLRRGLALQMRADTLIKISQGLKISITELLATFAPGSVELPQESASAEIAEEYDRLQTQMQQQRETLIQEFQQQTLQILESWMLQWPTAASKAQENPQLSAVKLLPLLRPIEQLLREWGVEAIATVGTSIPYNPQFHQLMEGTAQSGEPVKVRYTGYRQGDKLLHRAKVSPITSKVPET
ncbi:nucleotide exchange factor GrpE [Kamptonema sp. UHCC 0994]|uniref:nucleotide exchange factor GrpE n=1 Tax=Kamptonema sp. UHCC 0994 TaxID=3031329 RepID=UPI0023B954AE|nr:nucleotide exchange factor GrpE [Kamptonema sp. UHCC 0994]MDF0554620.1 nucleotide exchange factor GrpE [Kamptonema sp. UHCC 0994]